MANFATAYHEYIKPAEGGYSNVTADKGGETYAGISRRYFPNWEGWKVIDSYKENGEMKRNTIFPALDNAVTAFYFSRWNGQNFSFIQNQDIANLLFDFYVNSGGSAIKGIQGLVGVTKDGVMGQNTLKAINESNAKVLYSKLMNYRENFYKNIIAKDPTQKKFESGWTNRLAMFPSVSNIVAMLIFVMLVVVLLMFK